MSAAANYDARKVFVSAFTRVSCSRFELSKLSTFKSRRFACIDLRDILIADDGEELNE